MCSILSSAARTVCASKVDRNPNPAYECIGNPTGTTRAYDVLQVGLDEQCVPLKLESVGQLERRLVSLHSDGRIRQLRASLRFLQITAELPKNDAEAGRIRPPQWEKAADEEPSSRKERHLTDGLVRRDENRAGDAETAVVARLAEPKKNLVEQAIEAPFPSSDAGGVAPRDRC
jgi:hypothetical protein